jgi:glycosyltransferase involved in cell wall biosynthesis
VHEADKSPPNVAIIASTEFLGGAELYIQRLARQLKSRGVPICLVGGIPSWERANVPVIPLKSSPKWGTRNLARGLLSIRSEITRLIPIADSGQFEIANLHFKREQIGYTGTLAKRMPVIWTEHGLFPRGLFGVLVRPFYRRASRKVDSIVCVSETVSKDIRRVAHRRARVVTIQSGIDLEAFLPLSHAEKTRAMEKLRLPAGRPIAAIVGRLEGSKRPALAIRSALESGYAVVVAGDGQLRQALETEFRADPVLFVGLLESTRCVYGVADVHVFASNGRGEGFPTVLLESAAIGVPTVASDDCGFKDVIAAAGGAVARPDPKQLSAAIRLVYATQSTRSKQASGWAARFSTDAMVDGYLTEFTNAASSRTDRGARR